MKILITQGRNKKEENEKLNCKTSRHTWLEIIQRTECGHRLRPPLAKTTKYQGSFRINGARAKNSCPRILDLQQTLISSSPWRNGTSSASVSSLFNFRLSLCVLLSATFCIDFPCICLFVFYRTLFKLALF